MILVSTVFQPRCILTDEHLTKTMLLNSWMIDVQTQLALHILVHRLWSFSFPTLTVISYVIIKKCVTTAILWNQVQLYSLQRCIFLWKLPSCISECNDLIASSFLWAWWEPLRYQRLTRIFLCVSFSLIAVIYVFPECITLLYFTEIRAIMV